jgi:hypothetical protein
MLEPGPGWPLRDHPAATVTGDANPYGGRRVVYLVSYPRSGNTLVRGCFAILQGRPQPSIYPGDVVMSPAIGLSGALDNVVLLKSHAMPPGDDPVVYLVRDGRNATLSFLYMTFLFGGHRFSRLHEVHDAIRYLDRAEGSWAAHVASGLRESRRRPILFVRYEDLMRRRAQMLGMMSGFAGATLPAAVLEECVRRHAATDRYADNPFNGYRHQPEPGSIYDLLKRRRQADYWRHIFDPPSKRYFHETGATDALRLFGYETSADWWQR